MRRRTRTPNNLDYLDRQPWRPGPDPYPWPPGADDTTADHSHDVIDCYGRIVPASTSILAWIGVVIRRARI